MLLESLQLLDNSIEFNINQWLFENKFRRYKVIWELNIFL